MTSIFRLAACFLLTSASRHTGVAGTAVYVNEAGEVVEYLAEKMANNCDDGNACTEDLFDIATNTCSHVLIDCDDHNPLTIDSCDPNRGCQHTELLPDTISETIYLYEDAPSLSESDTAAILNWIKTEVTQIRNPFCWKKSYGRGVGEVLTKCPAGREKIGALCYTPCPDNYGRFGFDCHQKCPPNFRDDGLFCRLAEYGRGAGYPYKINEFLSGDGPIHRCEAEHGRGNCEWWGLIAYPKCKPGFSNFACCICRPTVPNCNALGFNGGLDLSCAKHVKIGDPVPMICRDELEQDGGLCYPPCMTGFDGVGPVCWQECDKDQVDCGAACAKTSKDCSSAVVDQVIAPFVVAANIATLGLASAPANAVNAVKIGDKTVSASTTVGNLMLKAVSKLQTVNPAGLAEKATVIKRITQGTLGTHKKALQTARKVASVEFSLLKNVFHSFATDFAKMTSPQIEETLNAKLRPEDAAFIKQQWARIQMDEMAKAEGWNIAGNVLDFASIVDISGVSGLVAAYAKPICENVVPFPKLQHE